MKINKLKEARKKLGLTQVEVASKAKITERSYQYYEAGTRTPTLYTAMKIADVLKTDVRKLFS